MSQEKRPVFAPRSEKQKLILMDEESDVLLCGGGAGGSKSYTCLMKALKYVQDPAARVVIVRESYPTLKLSGGLWDESHGIYSWFGGVPKIQRLTWEFPNGATIQFAALPDNIKEWQGMQASHILVDESASFKESDILFLLSRLRSAKYKGHLNLTMTCNPDNASFLFKWVEYCLDDEGIPKEGTEDIIRWFVNLDGLMCWGTSREELYEKHGAGKTLGVDFMPMRFRFIPLTVYDNPVLLKTNPGYLANLLAQPKVDQLRYLHGSWTAKDTGSLYFDRSWVKMVDYPPEGATGRVRAWDFAASEATSTTSPDYSVGVKMSRDKYGTYCVEDVVRFQARTDKVLKTVIETAKDDGLGDCDVCIPIDPAASGKTAAHFYLKVLAENGVAAKTKSTTGHSGKMVRFKPLCALAESGALTVVKADWNDAFFMELENFKGDRSAKNSKDDQVDAAADAFVMLARQVTIPSFSVPIISQPSPIPRI